MFLPPPCEGRSGWDVSVNQFTFLLLERSQHRCFGQSGEVEVEADHGGRSFGFYRQFIGADCVDDEIIAVWAVTFGRAGTAIAWSAKVGASLECASGQIATLATGTQIK